MCLKHVPSVVSWDTPSLFTEGLCSPLAKVLDLYPQWESDVVRKARAIGITGYHETNDVITSLPNCFKGAYCRVVHARCITRCGLFLKGLLDFALRGLHGVLYPPKARILVVIDAEEFLPHCHPLGARALR